MPLIRLCITPKRKGGVISNWHVTSPHVTPIQRRLPDHLENIPEVNMTLRSQAMIESYNKGQNHLLAALPVSDYKRLSAQLELIHLPQGKVLCEPDAMLRHVYFPTTAVISLLCVMEDGACTETA